MVALVTGARGFLGTYVARRLEDEGHRVVRAGRPEVDVPSPELDRLLSAQPPDLVVHLAGPASVPASVEDPAADFAGSVDVTSALLERLRPVRARFVLVSSAAVYGEPERQPVDEEQPLKPVSPYGFHRVACELLVREAVELRSLPACMLRVFSAYGEGLERQIMWDICRRALDGGEVVLHGTGEESRDFVHARDVAQAVAAAARSARWEGEAYNVGTGVETTIASLAQLLLDALGSDARVEFSGRARTGDPAHWRADIGRLAGLGFRPEIEVEDGARAYAGWARTRLAAA